MQLIDHTNNNIRHSLYVLMNDDIHIFHDISHFKQWNYPAFDTNKYFAVDTLYIHDKLHEGNFYGKVTSRPENMYSYWIEGSKETMSPEFLTQLMLLGVPLR